MGNLYKEMVQRQQEKFNNFEGVFFAFDNEQFDAGMRKIGLDPSDTKNVLHIGMGGYIHRNRSDALDAMFKENSKERQEAFASDKNGDGFILDALLYEMNNHEFSVTWDIDDALRAVGITRKQAEEDSRIAHAIDLAIQKYSEMEDEA